jgi:hypothetical protein
MSGATAFVTLFREMLRKQGARTLALAGWAVWACALPTNNAPPTAGSGGAGSGGTGNTAAGMNGGTSTGGTMTGGTMTGGTMTGGTMTGGTMTGGTAGVATGGTMTGGTAGTPSGGTGGAGSGQGGTAGTAGSMAGAGQGGTMAGAGQGGTAGSMAGAGSGGKGGTAGTAGTPGVLKHRYSFTGSNTTATDSVGGADGMLMNGATQGSGVVTLTGADSDQYVDLPPNVLSGLSAATLEAWASWTGGTANWQRVFDFGTSDGSMGSQGSTNTASPYLFFTPRAQATTNPNCTNATASRPRVAITSSGPANEYCAFGGAAFPAGTMTHIAVTVDSNIALYINGAPQGSPVAIGAALNVAVGASAWLGRSLFASDTEFAGTISEFRIYPTARSASQISASSSAGPDSVPTQ